MLTTMPEINYNALRVIGAGSDTVVITDETYAIKIGRVYEDTVEKLIKLSEHNLAVPVYYYRRQVDIKNTFFGFLKDTSIYSAGDLVSYKDYVLDDGTHVYTDILIVGLAEIYQSHDECVTECYHTQEIEETLSTLVEKAWEHNIRWNDDHIYNIGIYNGHLVILDV